MHVVHGRRQRDDGAGSARQQPRATARRSRSTWSSPTTSRLLLEAGVGGEPHRRLRHARRTSPNFAQMIPVTGAVLRRVRGQRRHRRAELPSNRANGTPTWPTATSTAGARAAIVRDRPEQREGRLHRTAVVNHFPNSILNDTWTSLHVQQRHSGSFTQTAGPALVEHARCRRTRSTCRISGRSERLTLSGAIRYDHSSSFFPEQQIGPNPFILVPTVIPAQDGTSYSDITPRLGVVYDLVRQRKDGHQGQYRQVPGRRRRQLDHRLAHQSVVRITISNGARTWTDANSNFALDCDLTQPGGAGSAHHRAATSAAAGNRHFGQTRCSPRPTIPRF